jgi:cytochrome c biogenesis protein
LSDIKNMSEPKSNIFWNFFRSVKLAITLLIILAVASIVGTIIPQQEGAREFAVGLNPQLFNILNSLNLFDMYHSLWFRLIMSLLAMNLVVCSVDRFPGTWKRFRMLPRTDRTKPFEGLVPERSFTASGELKNVSDNVTRFLGSRYKNIRAKGDEDGHYFYLDKGRYSHFGVYLVHLSVLFILIGALVGSFFGIEGYVNIPEGEQIDSVHLARGKGHLKLGFEVRCDKFFVDFYENGAPKEYRSELRFLENGKDMETRSVLVNHPVTFGGMTFYQASYGIIPGKEVRLRIVRKGSKQEAETIQAEVGKTIQLPGGEGQFQVTKVDADFMGVLGPAAHILIKPDQGEEAKIWIFQDPERVEKQVPDKMKQLSILNASAFKPYTFYLDQLENRYYTGLQVNRDPGVQIVWVGCLVMVTGFFITFFTSHRRIWVRVLRKKRGIKIDVAGTASKNPVGLQRELDHLTNSLRNMFN